MRTPAPLLALSIMLSACTQAQPPAQTTTQTAKQQQPVSASPSPTPSDSRLAQQSPGGVSLAEFRNGAAQRMLAADADRDGRVTSAEFADHARNPERAERRFARLDANRDGVLDRGEIDAMLERRFARRDADHDGRLTRDERLAFRAERQARRADAPSSSAPAPAPQG